MTSDFAHFWTSMIKGGRRKPLVGNGRAGSADATDRRRNLDDDRPMRSAKPVPPIRE